MKSDGDAILDSPMNTPVSDSYSDLSKEKGQV
jgi:hypothetical protein